MERSLVQQPPFEKLKTTTITVVTYANMTFSFAELFNRLNPVKVKNPPRTKKKGNVNKKAIKANNGDILSLSIENRFKGLNLRPNKKKWCVVNCREVKYKGKKEVKVNTLEPFVSSRKGNVSYISFYCSKCEHTFGFDDIKKISHFLNQLTFDIFYNGSVVSVMMFKSKLKMAGCKSIQDAVEIMKIIWSYVNVHPDCWSFHRRTSVKPRFIIEPTMKNINFYFGFPNNRSNLKKIFNSKVYSDVVILSSRESTSQTNVKIKIRTTVPEGYKYLCLKYTNDKPKLVLINRNRYNSKPPKPMTIIVFSSSKTTLSGRYDEEMKRAYDFFLNVCQSRRPELEEKLTTRTNFKKFIRSVMKKK